MAEATAQATFEWKGVDRSGEPVTGRMDGRNADQVKQVLRRQGVTPKRVKKPSKPLFGGGGQKVKTKDISIFSRQLATMIEAGVPLVQSFDIVGRGLANQTMRELVLNVRGDIEAGVGLSTALAQHPKHFDRLFCNLVAAGEQSGTLDSLLAEIASYKEKTEALKAKIKKAMFYPAAILVVATIVTAILLVFVIPKFKEMFESMGGELPAFTQLIVTMSDYAVEWWYVVVAAIGGAIFALVTAIKRSERVRNARDRFLLKLPLIGELIQKATIARFGRTLATMAAAGVPLVDALSSVAETADNAVYRKAIYRIRDDAATGTPLQSALEKTGLFPNMVVQMTAIGEESGGVDKMMKKVAEFYEEEVDNLVGSLTSMMEPLIMAVLGVVIGGLVVGMYLPVFQMGSAM